MGFDTDSRGLCTETAFDFLLPRKKANIGIREKLEVFFRIRVIRKDNFSRWVVVVVAEAASWMNQKMVAKMMFKLEFGRWNHYE